MLEMKPLGGALGVEVVNFDVLAEHSAQTCALLREAVAKHCVLLFREQDLSTTELIDFAAKFGPVMNHFSGFEHVDNDAKAYVNSSKKGSLRHAGNEWHTDYSYLRKPPFYSCLYFTKTPRVGGDTVFANTYHAYDALSAQFQSLLSELQAVHDVNDRYKSLYEGAELDVRPEISSNAPGAHPLVRKHPDTEKHCLYVSEALTKTVTNLPRKEGDAILEFLIDHCASPEFSYRHAWRVNDLAVFDNRCTVHRAISDYDLDDTRENRVVCMGGDWGKHGDPWTFQPH